MKQYHVSQCAISPIFTVYIQNISPQRILTIATTLAYYKGAHEISIMAIHTFHGSLHVSMGGANI